MGCGVETECALRIMHGVIASPCRTTNHQEHMKKLHWSLLKRLYRLRSRFGVYSHLNRKWILDNRNWVESWVFDETFSFSGIRALIKMDVEGAELMVLAGMRRFLSNNAVVLQVETTPQTLDQVDAFMGEAGYRPLGRLGADAYYGNI